MTQVGEFIERFWSLGPVAIFMMVLAIDYGLVNLLMWKPEGRFLRKRYLAFSIGDSPVGLPLGFAGLAALLADDILVSAEWSLASVLVGVGFVVGFAVMELATGQYTLEEELTPSKLAHTVVFGLLIALVVPVVIPGVRALSGEEFLPAAQGATVVGFGIWLVTVVADAVSGRKVPHAHKTKAMMARLGLE